MPTWETDTDWDGAVDESGVVHDQLGDHAGDTVLQQGYTLGSLTEGLVAYYPMEESGSTVLHDGALDYLGQINGATWNGSGQVGSDSLSFDGDDDYISLNASSVGPTVTISMWLKSSDASSSNYVYLVDSHNRSILCEWSSADGNLGYYDGSHHSIASNPSDGNWHMVTWVLDDSVSGEIFVDASSVGSDTYDSTSDTVTTIGSEFDGSSYFFNGQISAVRFYDRTLSQPEIEALYQLTAPSGREVTESDVASDGIARYELNGDATDSWGTNDGTTSGGVNWTDGVYGQAGDFDGTDDYIELPDLGLSSTQSFTISAWFRYINDGSYHTIIGRYDGTDDILRFRADDNTNATGDLSARLGHVNENEHLFSAENILTEQKWYHGSLIFDSSTPKSRLFLNGKLVANESGAIDDFATSDGPWIGRRSDSDQEFTGKIDDVRIYDRALTPIEVERLFSLGSHRISRSDVL